ncbi:MAG TPA: hypothetical protein VI136_05915 [Verrucomicrobiae bacterium]
MLVWSGLAATLARAESFNLTDGTSLEGTIVSANDKGAVVRLSDGKFAERTAWEKFSQEDLKRLAKDSKYARYAQPLVEEDEAELQKKKPVRPPVVVKEVESKLDRPANPALIGGLFTSPVGWLILLALYAANLWAAYEVAIFRAQPLGLVCGLAAVVPVIPQIVFVSMPTRMPKPEAGAEVDAAGQPAGTPPVEPTLASALKIAHETPEAAEAAPAAPTIFKRGEFAFNRRFFETRFSDFFGVVRREKSKGAVLVVKTAKSEFHAARISRITANDMHLEVMKGATTEEISVSFMEIQEVQLRPAGTR